MQISGSEQVQLKPSRVEDQHIHMQISNLGNEKHNHSDEMNEIPASLSHGNG